jgi:protein phosphatase
MPLEQTWMGLGLTDIGRVRKINQDAFCLDNEQQLWVLADGMGGHAGGEIASQIAVETIPEYFRSQSARNSSNPLPAIQLETIAIQAIESANQRIREHASQHSHIKSMGTTVVAIAITHDTEQSQAVIAHTGDSRAYVLRNKQLALWTRDHTLMEERLELKLITPDQVRTHPLRHVLTKALGIDPQAHPTVQTYSLEPTDLLLLCSDGLTKMLTDQEIQTLLLKDTRNLNAICHRLVETANRLGGEDNTTVVVVGADSDATLIDRPPANE